MSCIAPRREGRAATVGAPSEIHRIYWGDAALVRRPPWRMNFEDAALGRPCGPLRAGRVVPVAAVMAFVALRSVQAPAAPDAAGPAPVAPEHGLGLAARLWRRGAERNPLGGRDGGGDSGAAGRNGNRRNGRKTQRRKGEKQERFHWMFLVLRTMSGGAAKRTPRVFLAAPCGFTFSRPRRHVPLWTLCGLHGEPVGRRGPKPCFVGETLPHSCSPYPFFLIFSKRAGH